MTILDQVKKMKQGGYGDGQIVQMLQDQGVSPREINDAISQSKIKEAISGNEEISNNQEMEGMQPSIINQSSEEQNQYMPQFPGPEQNNQPEIEPISQEGQYATEGNQNIYQDSGFQNQQPDYQSYYGINTETMSEIASQLISEKLMKTQKDLSDLSEFKTIANAKVDKIDQRLQRIESIIDQLQTSLIRKSAGQSQDIEDVKTELKGMQSSFSKVLNPLADSIREIRGIKGEKTETTIKKTIKRSKK
jgi:hypothetical protein